MPSLPGLTCDTVISYTLVLPNGTVSEIDSSKPELFFALKGGLNRFGIVTQITFKLVPEVPQVYVGLHTFYLNPPLPHTADPKSYMLTISVACQGGYQVFPPTSIPALIKATADFSASNTDPKAQIILTLAYLAGTPNPVLLTFYDGPTPSPSLAPFKAIPALFSDVSTRSFSSLAKSAPDQLSANTRGAFHTLSTTGYTQGFIEAVQNETLFYGALAVRTSPSLFNPNVT